MLPPTLAARIEWNTLEAVPGTFVDVDLADRHLDLLFRVTLAGRPAHIYVVFEHQSAPHPLMAFRLVAYAVRVWERHLADHPGANTLPAIVLVVLHHGASGWTAARSLEALYDLDDATLEAASDHVLRLRFVLDDLARETDTALRGRAMTALGRLVLACLRHARDAEGLMRALGECAELVREVIAAPHGVAALQAVVRYVLMVHPAPAEIALRQLQEVHEDETVKEAVMTAGEELIRMGELRGEARGRRAVLRKLPGWRARPNELSVVIPTTSGGGRRGRSPRRVGAHPA